MASHPARVECGEVVHTLLLFMSREMYARESFVQQLFDECGRVEDIHCLAMMACVKDAVIVTEDLFSLVKVRYRITVNQMWIMDRVEGYHSF